MKITFVLNVPTPLNTEIWHMSYPESLIKLSARAIQLYVERADDSYFIITWRIPAVLLESVNRMNDSL
ncbi:MAG: hypothetical protein WDM78_22955 [Puia sp.]